MTDLTVHDIEEVKYFIEEKGSDVSRWCDWEKKQHLFAEHYPELLHALLQISIAEKTLQAVLDKMGNDCYDLWDDND